MIRSLRIAFLGNDRWSVPSLRAIADSGHELVAVITAPRRPAGRGNELRPTPVADAAAEAGLPLHEVETVRSGPGADTLAANAPDLLIVVAYGEILPQAVLDLAAIAPVNLHFSLLPELRGASPVQTALLEGRDETGVTTIVMDAGIDTGPVILRRSEPIEPGDDAGSLGDRLAGIGAEILVATADLFAEGAAEPRPQDEAAATFTRRLGADDRVLRWTEPARDLVNRTRAMSPEPGTRNSMPTCGFARMLRRLSSRRLPLRSPKARVLRSSTRTLPGGSPRGDTSHEPSAAEVASRKNGLASRKRREASSMWSIALSATTCVGGGTTSRSSSAELMTLAMRQG